MGLHVLEREQFEMLTKQQRKLQTNIKAIKTMKTITIRASFVTLCIVSLTLARLSRNIPSSSTAFTYGYNQARTLFSNGRGRGRGSYSCRKLDDVLVGFWPDVKRQIFATCESNYRLWSTNIQQCKSGAEKFATEKASECVALSDCRDLGDIASNGVAGVFCSHIKYSSGNNFFPPTCVAVQGQCC
jgi:hypothetical protein